MDILMKYTLLPILISIKFTKQNINITVEQLSITNSVTRKFYALIYLK